MARKAPDPKAKAKKQKIILAVGGVILLGLLAFQLPKLMKGSPPPPTAVATTTTDATGVVSPATGAAVAPSSTPASAELTFSSSVQKVASLSTFHARDPFKPLISSSTASESAASAPAAPPPAVAAPTTPAVAAPAKGPLFGTVEGGTASTSSSVPNVSKGSSLPTATIMFNGTRLQLNLGDAFPKSKPVFRLAGIQAGKVLVALVKGGLADGSTVITLPTRHPVTLVNTVDKRRYTLVLLTGKKGA